MFRLNIDGTPASSADETALYGADPDDTYRVQVEDEQTANGYGPYCRHCGGTIIDNGDGWVHEDSDGSECEPDDEHDDTEAEPEPLSWCNSAAIALDPYEDSVTVSISTGDPRGAFSFTVRRRPDTGELIMHLPYPGEPMPHEKLTALHPGTYAIGGS